MAHFYNDAFTNTAEEIRSLVSGFFRMTPEERLYKVSFVLDEAFRVPFFGFRVGLDPILSFVPFVGSWVGAGLSGYFFWEAWNLKVPWHVYLRMLGNTGIDAVLGSVPVAGVVFDSFFKANVRNRRILLRYIDKRKKGSVATNSVVVLDKNGRSIEKL